jgi:hypothetical protein
MEQKPNQAQQQPDPKKQISPEKLEDMKAEKARKERQLKKKEIVKK